MIGVIDGDIPETKFNLLERLILVIFSSLFQDLQIMGHGGKRQNSGRKTIGEKQKLIAELDSCIDKNAAFKKLAKLIDRESLPAIKLYLEYRYGKPKPLEPDDSDKEVSINFNDTVIPPIKWIDGSDT